MHYTYGAEASDLILALETLALAIDVGDDLAVEAALLGQYAGPRLPEGKILSEAEFAAAGVRWIMVKTA